MDITVTYLGEGVGLISDLPYKDGYYSNGVKICGIKKFCIANQNSFRCVIAITANYFQQHAADSLYKLGFREVACFKSAHDAPHENLSLWIKEFTKDFHNEYKIDGFCENCSVDFDLIKDYSLARQKLSRCYVIIAQPSVKNCLFLKQKGFKRIKNVPIFFHIEKGKELNKQYS